MGNRRSHEVQQDIDAWKAALIGWSDARAAIAPTIVDGRLIEPDTSDLDEALMSALRPIGARLAAWHAEVSGD